MEEFQKSKGVHVGVWIYLVRHNNNNIVQHDKSIAKIETSLEYLSNEIHSFIQSFQNNQIKTDPFTQKHSPLKITEEGYETVKRLGLDKMFQENWDRILELCKKELQSDNPYDIQKFFIEQAVVFPEKFITNIQIDYIKLDAYKTGYDLTSYMKVFAVMARDKYFELKEIDEDDIDKYDPNIQPQED